MNLRYFVTEKYLGCGAEGNLTMRMANGTYLNFLDDDDVLYPDHIETLMAEPKKHPEYKNDQHRSF